MFSCEYCEIFNNSFFIELLRWLSHYLLYSYVSQYLKQDCLIFISSVPFLQHSKHFFPIILFSIQWKYSKYLIVKKSQNLSFNPNHVAWALFSFSYCPLCSRFIFSSQCLSTKCFRKFAIFSLCRVHCDFWIIVKQKNIALLTSSLKNFMNLQIWFYQKDVSTLPFVCFILFFTAASILQM